jgi:hypothetical protein
MAIAVVPAESETAVVVEELPGTLFLSVAETAAEFDLAIGMKTLGRTVLAPQTGQEPLHDKDELYHVVTCLL